MPEFWCEGLGFFPGVESEGDTAVGVEESPGDEVSVVCDEAELGAGIGGFAITCADPIDGSGEDPWMATEEGLSAARPEDGFGLSGGAFEVELWGTG